MVVKLIKVYVKPGHLADYLAAQAVWNGETGSAAGNLGCFCGCDPREREVVHVMAFWRSREDLQRWMEEEHDRIAELAGAAAHYDLIETRVLDEVLPGEVWLA